MRIEVQAGNPVSQKIKKVTFEQKEENVRNGCQ